MLETQALTVKDLLAQHGITKLNDFKQRAGLSRQHAWLLWQGKAGVGKVTMTRFRTRLGIPAEEMLLLTPQSTPKVQEPSDADMIEPVGDEVS